MKYVVPEISSVYVGIPYFCVWKPGRLRKTSLIR